MSDRSAQLEGGALRSRPPLGAAVGEALRARAGAVRDALLGGGLALVALLLRKLLPIDPGVGVYPLPLSAVIIAAWWLGRGPALVATLVSAVGIACWFLPPLEPLGTDLGHAIGLGIFVAVAFLAVQFSLARRRAERALRESEARLRRNTAYLTETQRLSHTGSWAWVPGSGEIRYLSEEGRRILGVSQDEEPLRLGPTLLDRILPDERASAGARLDDAVAHGSDFELEFRVAHPDGTVRDVFAVGHPVRDAAGAVAEFVGTLVDATERNRAEREHERLRQAQADLERIDRVSTLGELSASLSHEIRQPIAAALTNARTCLRWLDRPEPDLGEARAAAARAADDTTRAAEIIARLRSLFQKAPPRREPVEPAAVAGEMVSVLRREAERRAVTVHTAFAPDLPPVPADRVQLQQVLMNLMVNAIEAMKDAVPPRELKLRIERQAEVCLFSVVDTGPGVPPDRAATIFDTYFTTKPNGTGMGLSISRSIVEAHGGRLWVEPGDGRGAAFRFTIPIAGQGEADR